MNVLRVLAIALMSLAVSCAGNDEISENRTVSEMDGYTNLVFNVSGLTVTQQPTRAALSEAFTMLELVLYKVGDDGRSVWVDMDGASFSTKNIYKVAFNSYMASTVTIESVDEGRSLFKTSEEMMIEFLRKQKVVDYQGITRTE